MQGFPNFSMIQIRINLGNLNMDRPMCSALLRFGSFPHHNEVGALVVFSKSAMPRLYGNGMCCSIHLIIQFFYAGKS